MNNNHRCEIDAKFVINYDEIWHAKMINLFHHFNRNMVFRHLLKPDHLQYNG